jgi:hypothetical protein
MKTYFKKIRNEFGACRVGKRVQGVNLQMFMNMIDWKNKGLIEKTTIYYNEYKDIKKDLKNKGLI